jgi:transposase
VALGRKNWLFCGSEAAGHRTATLITLVETCKLQGLDPFAYLKDVLVRIGVYGEARAAELTPRAWKAARDAGKLPPLP